MTYDILAYGILSWALPFIAIATLVLSIFGGPRTRLPAWMGGIVFLIGFIVGQLPRLPLMDGSATGIILVSALLETIGIGLLALAAILPPPRPTSTGYGAPPPGLYGAPAQASSHQSPPTTYRSQPRSRQEQTNHPHQDRGTTD